MTHCGGGLTGKGTLAASEDERTDTVVVVKRLNGLVELVEEGGTEGVEGLWAVEGDEGDAVGGAGGEDVLELGRRHEADADGGGGVAVGADGAEGGGGGGGERAAEGEHGLYESCV